MVPGDLLRNLAQRNPRGAGIVFEGRTFSWQEVNERVNRFANALLALGLVKGDRVAVYAQNSHWYAETFYALAKAGMAVVPINWQSTPAETAFILQNAEAKALVADDQYLTALEPVAKQAGVRHVIRLGSDEKHPQHYESLIARQPASEPPVEVSPDDMRGLGYTSGTTGNPKGCVVTHRQTLAGLANYLIEIPVPRERATLLTVPFFTGYGAYMVYCAAYSRSTMVIHRQFVPTKVFEDIERYKVAHMCVVPTMIVGLLNSADLKKHDLTSLRLIVYGGSVIAPDVLKRAMETFPCDYCQVYGMQEAGGFVFFLTPEDHRKLKDGSEAMQKRMLSCGRIAQFGQIRLADGNDGEVKRGEHGELMVKSDATVSGYFKNPEMTAQTIRDGWVITGDIAYQDEEGYVYIADRKKDMIVSGGMNIYPAEVEAVLYKHPAVAQVAVIGVPDERWGEAVKAVVELKKGAKATETELIEFCKQHLASQKKPKSVDFVDALPVTNAGKVSKKEIREKYWQGRERKV